MANFYVKQAFLTQWIQKEGIFSYMHFGDFDGNCSRVTCKSLSWLITSRDRYMIRLKGNSHNFLAGSECVITLVTRELGVLHESCIIVIFETTDWRDRQCKYNSSMIEFSYNGTYCSIPRGLSLRVRLCNIGSFLNSFFVTAFWGFKLEKSEYILLRIHLKLTEKRSQTFKCWFCWRKKVK